MISLESDKPNPLPLSLVVLKASKTAFSSLISQPLS